MFVEIKSFFEKNLSIKSIVSDSITSITINRSEDEKYILLNDSLKTQFILLLNKSEYNSDIQPRKSKNLARVFLTHSDMTIYTIDIRFMFESEKIAIMPQKSSVYYYNKELGAFVQEIIRRNEVKLNERLPS